MPRFLLVGELNPGVAARVGNQFFGHLCDTHGVLRLWGTSMSIADHFDHAPDAGLVRKYDSGMARRQFNVSLVLVGVIMMAATALGFLVRFDTPANSTLLEGRSVAISPVTPTMPSAPPAYAGHL